ncbi:hypothetical protein HID58_094775 [Brassica napus]|uniref:Uncharacterized protein n=1 Tax=Brassica napus TaxID=3708 RepID=A0ABQ7X8M9_BRANA|nr:hypothetical protein HID58_094775 [Brassica napus]
MWVKRRGFPYPLARIWSVTKISRGLRSRGFLYPLARQGEKTLAEEFGSVAKATDLDFVYVSPSKATKDDKDAKVPAYRRGCRGRCTVKDEDASDKKKAVQAEAALKRKEKTDAKRKEA